MALAYVLLASACSRNEASVPGTAAAGGSGVNTPSSGPQTSVARIEVSPGLERTCRQICDRSHLLKCENAAQCMPNCLAMGSATPCT
jgi:hypothetical protein